MKFWASLVPTIIAASLAWPLTSQAQQAGLTPIITYDQEHPLVNVRNLLPMVQIYSSGEAVVFRGPAMTNPGRYVLQLDDDELATLVSLAETTGLLQFDASAELAANTNEGLSSVSSDPTISTFELNRVAGENILSAGDGTTTDAMQAIIVEDVLSTASSLPDSPTAEALSELHIRLIQLFSQAGE